jgi:hypothetical protein
MTDQKLGNSEDEQTTPAALPARVVSGLEGSDDPGQLESAAGSLGVAESVGKRGGKESIIRQNPRLPVLPSTWSSFCPPRPEGPGSANRRACANGCCFCVLAMLKDLE